MFHSLSQAESKPMHDKRIFLELYRKPFTLPQSQATIFSLLILIHVSGLVGDPMRDFSAISAQLRTLSQVICVTESSCVEWK